MSLDAARTSFFLLTCLERVFHRLTDGSAFLIFFSQVGQRVPKPEPKPKPPLPLPTTARASWYERGALSLAPKNGLLSVLWTVLWTVVSLAGLARVQTFPERSEMTAPATISTLIQIYISTLAKEAPSSSSSDKRGFLTRLTTARFLFVVESSLSTKLDTATNSDENNDNICWTLDCSSGFLHPRRVSPHSDRNSKRIGSHQSSIFSFGQFDDDAPQIPNMAKRERRAVPETLTQFYVLKFIF